MQGASMGGGIADVDEDEKPSPLSPAMPFPFWFYGSPVPKIWAGANGYIGFGENAPDAVRTSIGGPRPLGDVGGFPGKGVLAFWGGPRTGTLGGWFTPSGRVP